jgi:hypothetical protein
VQGGSAPTPLVLRGLLINKIPVFTWRGFAAPGENWDFTGILFYGKPLNKSSIAVSVTKD